MMTPKRLTYLSPAALQVASGNLVGTTVKLAIDRTWPIEEIIVLMDIRAHGTPLSTLTCDGVLKLLKRVNFSINDGIQPRSAVDFTGPGLLEYALHAGLNLGPGTMECIRATIAGTLVASSYYRIGYRIPLVHPIITEPLRTRMLCDVNNHPQDPVLTLDFGTTAEMAGAGTQCTVELADVILVRRQVSRELDERILKDGGFIKSDLIETAFQIGTGVSGEQRWQVPTPGQYANLLLRHYKGGAAVTRNDVSETLTLGSETRWRLESGGVVIHDWRNKHLQELNAYSRVLNSSDQTYAPNPGEALAAATLYQDPAHVMLDFLSDGVNGNQPANELGSLLDCNLPTNSGLKMEVIGSVGSVATNGSTLYIGGQRFFGDLSRWQALA
jgi:hypothetical protein